MWRLKFSFVIAAVFSLANLGFLAAGSQRSIKCALPGFVFVEAPQATLNSAVWRFPHGSRLMRMPAGGGQPVMLTPDFYAAADPRISYSGKKLLFAGKQRRGGRWQIWQMTAAGGGQRQLTHGAADCLAPAWLPGGHILYSCSGGSIGPLGAQIYVARSDGSQAHPITFGPGNFRVEAVLHNGRILVSATAPLARAADSQRRALYTMRPDGSELRLLRWRYPRATNAGQARELADGTILFIARQPGTATGALAWYRPQSPQAALLPPSGAQFGSARLLDGAKWLLSGALAAHAMSKTAPGCGIYVYNAAARAIVAQLYQTSAASCSQATPLEPRLMPLRYFSILHPLPSGRVICLNAYRSMMAPNGRWPRARLARVRVQALRNGRAATLGSAPIEPDGSFYLRLPADLPLRFELLDARGAIVEAQRSWIWVRPGEDAGCQSCHGNPALAPANRWPLALKRRQAPITFGMPGVAPVKKIVRSR